MEQSLKLNPEKHRQKIKIRFSEIITQTEYFLVAIFDYIISRDDYIRKSQFEYISIVFFQHNHLVI